ncbi:hypothetical protein LJB83_02060, partial [Clostridia bacterium OttesenSCG-928-F22]|nr:hypothetical protein [Clostridia bacterium OttesenSCG-928-F22]
IPGHFDFEGNVTRWASPFEILIPLAAGVLIYALITLIMKHPKWWNTITTITDENRQAVHGNIYAMMAWLRLLICAIFAFLSINMLLAVPLPGLFLPIVLVLLFGIMVFFGIRGGKIARKYRK